MMFSALKFGQHMLPNINKSLAKWNTHITSYESGTYAREIFQ